MSILRSHLSPSWRQAEPYLDLKTQNELGKFGFLSIQTPRMLIKRFKPSTNTLNQNCPGPFPKICPSGTVSHGTELASSVSEPTVFPHHSSFTLW